MDIEDRIRQRLQSLIDGGERLRLGRSEMGGVMDEDHRSRCVGWLAAAAHVVSLICPKLSDSYRLAALTITSSMEASNYAANDAVGQLTAVLRRLADDVDDGLVASVVAVASAETLDDLLDQADEYYRRPHKQGAGILATAVFEDTVRRIARAHEVEEAGIRMDTVITALDQKESSRRSWPSGAERRPALGTVRCTLNGWRSQWRTWRLSSA